MNLKKYPIGKWFGYLLLILPLPVVIYTIFKMFQSTFLSVYGALLIVCLSVIPIMFGAALIVVYKPAEGRNKFLWKVELLLFALYLFFLYIVLFRADRIQDDIEPLTFLEYTHAHSNFIPFGTLKVYVEFIVHERLSSGMAFENIAGNILVFMPMGAFLPLIWEKLMKVPYFIVAMLLLLIAIEFSQLLTQLGNFDVDDIMLNFLGAMIVYIPTRGKDMRVLLKSMYLLR